MATGISIEMILAQIVGWLVIVGSTVRSVPQILRILRNKSVDGLSLSSFVSELSAYIITVAYNMKFGYEISTWGETCTSAVQHGILVALIFHFNKETSKQAKLLTVALLLFGTTFLFSSLSTEAILRTLQSLVAIILAVGGRMPQIRLNIKRGNSGELSFTSTLLSVLGNIARVFTTWVLVKDPIIMATAVSQLSLNSVLLFQIVQTMKGNAPYRQQMAA
jgi:mannose-P-dolichol utilization defect protein 1